MVIVNDQKFACQSCIKGHRSSACNHTDRPLFEIRKKGRPATQCDDCRDLRRTRRLHVKCACEGRRDPESEIGPVQLQPPTNGNKFGRKIPLIPKLPNGVRDIETSGPSNVEALTPTSPNTPALQAGESIVENSRDCVRPARSCCSKKAAASPQPATMEFSGDSENIFDMSMFSPSPSTPSSLGVNFSLPPSNLYSNPNTSKPSSSTQRAIHGMDCLCGPGCLCIGCTKHQQGPEGDVDMLMLSGDCPADCPSCIDNSSGAMWPGAPSSHHIPTNHSATSNWFFPSEPSQSINVDFGMGRCSDDEIDAEGSPDPDFCTLPDVSAYPQPTTFGLTAHSPNSGKQVEVAVNRTKKSCCSGKRQNSKSNSPLGKTNTLMRL